MQVAPSLEEFDALAREAFAALPKDFRNLCGNVVIHVAEQAEPEILRHFRMTNPLQLSGLFEGVGLPNKGFSNPFEYPNHVHLYRRAILAEWRSEPGLDLKQLIMHVLVHEIGHHFGLSDADMHAIEDAADRD